MPIDTGREINTAEDLLGLHTCTYLVYSLLGARRPRFRPNKGFAHNLALGTIPYASIDLKKKKKYKQLKTYADHIGFYGFH